MSSGEEKAGSGQDWSDDGSEAEPTTAADKSSLFGELSSSGSSGDEQKADVTSKDLFGDADDISSDSDDQVEDDGVGFSEPSPPMQQPESRQQSRPLHRARMDDDDDGGVGHGFDIDENEASQPEFSGFPDDDDEEEPEPEPVTNVIEADMPIFPSMMNEQLFFVKMPNFLSVEPRAFDADLYDEEVDEEELQDEEGRSRLKLKIENTIRWRYAKDSARGENDEERERESNARIIRWSDDSASLMLGGEVFDIHQTPLGSGDFSHLFVQQGTGLQGQAVFHRKLTFRPHSTDSHTHRKITMSIADRLGKTQKIRVLPVVGKDPDAHRTEMMKKEEDRLRSAVRLENQQKRMRDRQHNKGGRPTTSFLESFGGEEDDDDETSIEAIKRGVKPLRPKAHARKPAKRRAPKASRKRVASSGDDDDDDDDEIDDDGDGYDDGDGFIDDGDEEGSDDEIEEDDNDDEDEEEEAKSTSEEEAPAPKKTQKRKSVEKDAPSSKKKKIRSKHMISSSDESD